MDTVIMNSPDYLSRSEMLILSPGGSHSYTLKVMNTGDMTDDAIFDFTGLTGTATRTLSYRGMPIDGPISIPKGWGAFNESTGTFYFDGNSPLIGSNEDKIFDKIVANGLVDSHVAAPYYAIVTLNIGVNSGAVNGDGGLLEIVVTSVANAANRSGKVTISLSVETILEVEMEILGEIEANVTLGKADSSHTFKVMLSNSGNVESEFKVFTSDELRGWTVTLIPEDVMICTSNRSTDYLLCTLEEGGETLIKVKVSPPIGDTVDVEDSFSLVLTAEPSETGLVDRVNLVLTVNGQPSESWLNGLITPNVLYGIGAVVLLGFAYLALRRRD